MSDGTASTQPEGVLMKLFADPLWFERIFASIERLQNCQGRADQLIIAENAAETDEAFVCMNRYKRVDAIFGLQLVAPAPFGRGATQTGASDFPNFHEAVLNIVRKV